MKKFAFTLVVLAVSASSAIAQKYVTREGYIKFFSSTSMENIEASTNQASSIIDAESGDVVFQVLMRSFTFEKALMQEHFNENYVESESFPKATFSGKITNLSAVDFSVDGTYNVTIAGKLSVHGVEKNRTVQGVITVKDGEVLLETEFIVVPEDHDIEIPSVVRDNIAREIKLTVKAKYQVSNR